MKWKDAGESLSKAKTHKIRTGCTSFWAKQDIQWKGSSQAAPQALRGSSGKDDQRAESPPPSFPEQVKDKAGIWAHFGLIWKSAIPFVTPGSLLIATSGY